LRCHPGFRCPYYPNLFAHRDMRESLSFSAGFVPQGPHVIKTMIIVPVLKSRLVDLNVDAPSFSTACAPCGTAACLLRREPARGQSRLRRSYGAKNRERVPPSVVQSQQTFHSPLGSRGARNRPTASRRLRLCIVSEVELNDEGCWRPMKLIDDSI